MEGAELTSTSALWHTKPLAANASHLIPHRDEYSKTIKQKEQKQRKGNKASWGHLGQPAQPMKPQQRGFWEGAWVGPQLDP